MRSVFFLILVASIFLFSCSEDREREREKPKQPNILFIFTDDHATQSIGAYGSIINETPNLDRLAEQGMIFQNAAVTNSICGPSCDFNW